MADRDEPAGWCGCNHRQCFLAARRKKIQPPQTDVGSGLNILIHPLSSAVFRPLLACSALARKIFNRRLARAGPPRKREPVKLAAHAREISIIGELIHEFWLFGLQQAHARVFGGFLLAVMIVTGYWYPLDDLHRYDFIFIAAVGFQLVLLLARLETIREAAVIVVFHVVATVMEAFKTSESIGSWSYPEVPRIRTSTIGTASAGDNGYRVEPNSARRYAEWLRSIGDGGRRA